MSPLLKTLDATQRAEFVDAYPTLAVDAYPPNAEGKTLFPFRRFSLVAERGNDG